jgi:uncharacterized membrane protein
MQSMYLIVIGGAIFLILEFAVPRSRKRAGLQLGIVFGMMGVATWNLIVLLAAFPNGT